MLQIPSATSSPAAAAHGRRAVVQPVAQAHAQPLADVQPQPPQGKLPHQQAARRVVAPAARPLLQALPQALPQALQKPGAAKASSGVRRPLDFGPPLSVAAPEPAHGQRATVAQSSPTEHAVPTHYAAVPMQRAVHVPVPAASTSPTESKPAARRKRAVWKRAPIPLDFEIPSVPSPTGSGRKPP